MTKNVELFNDVKRFLARFKVIADTIDLRFREDRQKNVDTLLELGISTRLRRQIVMSLEVQDYVKGPIVDTLNKGGEMWVFGRDYNGRELYIKLQIDEGAVCISFHEAEHPMNYPFK